MSAGKCVVHLVVGEKALRLAHLDELLDFFPITILRRHRSLGASAATTQSGPDGSHLGPVLLFATHALALRNKRLDLFGQR